MEIFEETAIAPAHKRKGSELGDDTLPPKKMSTGDIAALALEPLPSAVGIDSKLDAPDVVGGEAQFEVAKLRPELVMAKGGFPRFKQQAKCNLFGNKALPIAVYSLDHEDALLFKTVLGVDVKYERIVLKDSVAMGKLVKALDGTSIGDLELANLVMVYQNAAIELDRKTGLTIEATVSITAEGQGELHNHLVRFLGVSKPELVLTCALEMEQPKWKKPLPPVSAYVLRGSFPDIRINSCDEVVLTSLSLTITAASEHKLDEEDAKDEKVESEEGTEVVEDEKAEEEGDDETTDKDEKDEEGGKDEKDEKPHLEVTHVLSGSINFQLPGLAKPVHTTFELSKPETQYRIDLVVDEEWKDAFEVTGLTLQKVALRAGVDPEKAWKSTIFGLCASLDLAGTSVAVVGTFSLAGDFAFSLKMEKITWDTIAAIHEHFHPDQKFSKPEIALNVRAIVLTISKASGLVIELDGVQLGDFLGVSGVLTLGPHGGSIGFGLQGNTLKLGDVDIYEARISAELEVMSADGESQKVFSLAASGRFRWKTLDVVVGARLYTMEGVSGLQYTMYGDLADVEGGFRLKDHIPGIEDTVLADIVLNKVMLIVASRDDSHPSLGVPVGYEVEKGVQLAIDIGSCASLSQLFGKDDLALLMAVYWRPDFPCDIKAMIKTTNLPPLQLGEDFKTGDVKLNLAIDNMGPKVSFTVGAEMTVHGHKEKLHFEITGTLNAVGVEITGSMDGHWHNPFDLSPKLSVGPNLVLTMQISYALAPTKFGFVGGLKIGKVTGGLALQVAATPQDQLAAIKCENLDLNDVLELLDGTDHAAIKQPDNVVSFKMLEMYVCPFGTTIGKVVYPKGFMFDCEATLFDKAARVHVEITVDGFLLEAWVDAFDIGPFRISGAGGPNERLRGKLCINKHEQSGSLSGMIEGPGVRGTVAGSFSFHPFTIAFKFDLKVHNVFELQAAIGPLPPGPGEVAPPAASILDSGLRLEARYQDHHLHEILTRLVSEWRQTMHIDCERRRIQTLEDISRDMMNSGRPSPEHIWSGIHNEAQTIAAEKMGPVIEDILRNFSLKRVYIRMDIQKHAKAFSYHAEVGGTVKDQPFAFTVDFVIDNVNKFIRECVQELVERFKKLLDNIVDNFRNTIVDELLKIEAVKNAQKVAQDLMVMQARAQANPHSQPRPEEVQEQFQRTQRDTEAFTQSIDNILTFKWLF